MVRRWLLRGIVTLGALAATSGELHAEERARLVYVREAGAEKCPAEVDLRLRVVARLGYDPFSPQASSFWSSSTAVTCPRSRPRWRSPSLPAYSRLRLAREDFAAPEGTVNMRPIFLDPVPTSAP